MDEILFITTCPHGLTLNAIDNKGEINTYCAGCLHDALYDDSLGIYMGLHPNIKRRIRNKEKSKRKKDRLHG